MVNGQEVKPQAKLRVYGLWCGLWFAYGLTYGVACGLTYGVACGLSVHACPYVFFLHVLQATPYATPYATLQATPYATPYVI